MNFRLSKNISGKGYLYKSDALFFPQLIESRMLWWFAILVFCYLACKFVIKPTRYWEELGVPHIKGWPLTGSISEAIFRKKALCDLTKEFYQKFPKER